MIPLKRLIAISITATLALSGASSGHAQSRPPSAEKAQSSSHSDMMPGTELGASETMGQGMMAPTIMEISSCGATGPMMQLMFAIGDTNGDGGLSFEEVTAIHKRIFEQVDQNNDHKVTLQEMQAFWRR